MRLLRTASDHALYSSLDADGAVETRVASFVASAASRAATAPDAPRGWSDVIDAVAALDFELIEPHARVVFRATLSTARDDSLNLARNLQTVGLVVADSRLFPDACASLGDVVVSGETIHAAIVDDDVLHTFREASRSTPLAQTPALMETCREMFSGRSASASPGAAASLASDARGARVVSGRSG